MTQPGPRRTPAPAGPVTAVPGWSARSESVLIAQQVEAMSRWHRARRLQEAAAATRVASREQRLDLARRLEVLRRQHQAMVERTDLHLRDSARLLRGSSARRAMVVHRDDWYVSRLSAALHENRVEVLARLTNGADAVGAAVAEQPDLILIEDTLPMQSGLDVVREVLAYAPATLVAVQVAHRDGVEPMLAAGASAVFTRRDPPVDVAATLASLLPGG